MELLLDRGLAHPDLKSCEVNTPLQCSSRRESLVVHSASISSPSYSTRSPGIMACSVNAKLLRLVISAIVVWACLGQGSCAGPRNIVLYAHESRVPPSNTLIVSASPSGNKSGADEFGLIRTISNVLRAGPASDSTILGSQVGIVVVGKDKGPIYISFTYFLNTNATHKGTIAVHGHIDGTSTGDRVFSVVGGTGDFLSATGEDRSPYDFPNIIADPANVVNVHTFTLFYHHQSC